MFQDHSYDELFNKLIEINEESYLIKRLIHSDMKNLTRNKR